MAVGFTAILNVALVATLVWTEWLGSKLLVGCWGGLGVLWVASTVIALRGNGGAAEPEGPLSDGDPMRQAQEAYLRGNWFEAEKLLKGMIGRDARDVDARLMLATLKRHTGQLEEAAVQLERLERLEAAAKWEPEILAERRLLEALRAESGE